MVGVEAEVSDLGTRVQTLNDLDRVEAEVEPLQVHEGLQVADLADNVVVKLELG